MLFENDNSSVHKQIIFEEFVDPDIREFIDIHGFKRFFGGNKVRIGCLCFVDAF